MKRSLICLFVLAVASAATAQTAGMTAEDAARMMDQGKTAEAIRLFENLAEEGDDKAMVALGIYHSQGIGVVQDYSKAMDWFLRAFSKQNADAFVSLGLMHRDGLGVPENRRIAYCVFLTTHMCGLGSQWTQSRSNHYLRRLIKELPKEDIRECLSNYTMSYITAYLQAKGKMNGIPDRYKPSEDNPALKDLGWFLEHELDALFGEPAEEERRDRAAKARNRQREYEALTHTLVFQARYSQTQAHRYTLYEVITDRGMTSGRIAVEDLHPKDENMIYENKTIIHENRYRHVTIASDEGVVFVYRISHPAKAAPCDWSDWQKPSYALGKRVDSFALLDGREPKDKLTDVPAHSPELRFKVVKE